MTETAAPILLIDNYDSFVHNLARYFEELSVSTVVVRNDRLSLTDLDEIRPAAIVLSPGPCGPEQAGICISLIRQVLGQIPLLGVCLGHQALGAALGGRVERAEQPIHGQTSYVHHDQSGLFAGLENPFLATRYHSLIVSRADLPASLRVTAWTEQGVIMGLEHESGMAFGVQFHPESILTAAGHRMLANFLTMAHVSWSGRPVGDRTDGDADSTAPGGDPSQAWQRAALKVSAHW